MKSFENSESFWMNNCRFVIYIISCKFGISHSRELQVDLFLTLMIKHAFFYQGWIKASFRKRYVKNVTFLIELIQKRVS